MSFQRSTRKKRAIGPGVIERPAPEEDDLVLTRGGLGRTAEEADGEAALVTPQPRFDAALPLSHPGGGFLATQVLVERGRTAVLDVIVPVTQRVRSWHCYVRTARGHKWRGVAPVARGQGLAAPAGRSTLRLRSAPTPRDSETAEIAWRWKLDNVPSSGRGSDLLARVVVEVDRGPAPR